MSEPRQGFVTEPGNFSQEVIQVAPGDYRTLDYADTRFAGHQQGWFQIASGERTGRIRNGTWTIAASMSARP